MISHVAVLGATGPVGSLIVDRLLARDISVTAQSRSADKLDESRVRISAFDPARTAGYAEFLDGADAVVFALGTRSLGWTKVFTNATRALLPEMARAGVTRLVAITGVGAAETRGHGGFVHDWITFPLVTSRVYADKTRQEQLIEATDLDWTIVRPAPFKSTAPHTPLSVVTEIAPSLNLTSITREEAADFVVGELIEPRYIGEKPFIGHE